MACPTGKICVNPPDPRINYNLMPGEVLYTCPYNESHAVLGLRFTKHVLNCARLHCKDQKAKGEKSLFAVCRYKMSHHVRHEELKAHEAQCKIDDEKEDDWSDDDLPGGSPKPKEEYKGVPLRPPPPIDEASMKTITGESWEEDATSPHFDLRENRVAVHQKFRLEGYNVVDTLGPIGLTKSEKREFYKQDAKEMRKCAQLCFLNKMKKENAATGGSFPSGASGFNSNQPAPPTVSSTSTSCSSVHGFGDPYDTLGSIREDEDFEDN